MKSVNRVTLLGHVGMLENKTLDGDKCVANFSVATNTQWLDKAGQKQEAVEWHRCVAWGKLGERAGQFLKKGAAVYLEGHLKTRKWTDDTGADHYCWRAVKTDQLCSVNFDQALFCVVGYASVDKSTRL